MTRKLIFTKLLIAIREPVCTYIFIYIYACVCVDFEERRKQASEGSKCNVKCQRAE